MDFNEKPEEAAYRQKVVAWLDSNSTRKTGAEIADATSEAEEAQALEAGKAWQAQKADAGFVGIHWPKEQSGQGLTPNHTVVYQTEEQNYDVPSGYFSIGLGMCAPVMMKYATPAQVERYIPKMMRGDEIWCQLFSEPSAGSDVAAIRTTARRDGDDWIINGQKVWTSGAYYCDYGIMVTRHDPTVPKHKGLTYFFFDMKTPGVEVRRIKSIPGRSHFCEVFFNDVRIPDSQRLGAVGDGWKVAVTTLMHERLAVGQATGTNFHELFALARGVEVGGRPALEDAAVRDKLADWYVNAQGLKYGRYRMLTALSRGEMPGPEASINKIVSASQVQEVASFGLDLLDMAGVVDDPNHSAAEAMFQASFLSSPGYRIAGGTDEILRNIIAERVLGLPDDVRVDKEVPFNQIPTGSA